MNENATQRTDALWSMLRGLDTRSVSAYWFRKARAEMEAMERDLCAANARIAELEKDAARLRAGLEWYAGGEHYIFEGPFDRRWEIEEGWLCPPTDDSWMVEPGRVARVILDGHSMNPDKDADEITLPPGTALAGQEKAL